MSKLNTNTINLQDILTAVNALPEVLDTSDATATPSTMLSDATAYVDGKKITGTIPTKTASNLTASGATVTVPAGYYASQATKSVPAATQATPSISVSSAGLITASATQTAGYVAAGTKLATEQMTVQAAKTVTPTTSVQTAVASGVYTTGVVKVAAIPSNYEDVTTETTAYTDLNTELEEVINSLPDAGSGGGASVEICTVTGCMGNSGTLTIRYSNGTELVTMTVTPNADFSFNPMKNSLVVVVTSDYGEFGTYSWDTTGDIEVVAEDYDSLVCFSVCSDGTIGYSSSEDPEL